MGTLRAVVNVRSAPTSESDATTEYLRRVRRVRARFGNDPARMHKELQGLAPTGHHASNEIRPRVRRVMSPLPGTFAFRSNQTIAEVFAGEVQRAIEGGVLRYSRRAKLLKHAQRLGLGRFEANLIIATMQHRQSEFLVNDEERQGRHWSETALLVIAVQSFIVLGGWWLLRG